jgi:hypothetical protein
MPGYNILNLDIHRINNPAQLLIKILHFGDSGLSRLA